MKKNIIFVSILLFVFCITCKELNDVNSDLGLHDPKGKGIYLSIKAHIYNYDCNQLGTDKNCELKMEIFLPGETDSIKMKNKYSGNIYESVEVTGSTTGPEDTEPHIAEWYFPFIGDDLGTSEIIREAIYNANADDLVTIQIKDNAGDENYHGYYDPNNCFSDGNGDDCIISYSIPKSVISPDDEPLYGDTELSGYFFFQDVPEPSVYTCEEALADPNIDPDNCIDTSIPPFIRASTEVTRVVVLGASGVYGAESSDLPANIPFLFSENPVYTEPDDSRISPYLCPCQSYGTNVINRANCVGHLAIRSGSPNNYYTGYNNLLARPDNVVAIGVVGDITGANKYKDIVEIVENFEFTGVRIAFLGKSLGGYKIWEGLETGRYSDMRVNASISIDINDPSYAGAIAFLQYSTAVGGGFLLAAQLVAMSTVAGGIPAYAALGAIMLVQFMIPPFEVDHVDDLLLLNNKHWKVSNGRNIIAFNQGNCDPSDCGDNCKDRFTDDPKDWYDYGNDDECKLWSCDSGQCGFMVSPMYYTGVERVLDDTQIAEGYLFSEFDSSGSANYVHDNDRTIEDDWPNWPRFVTTRKITNYNDNTGKGELHYIPFIFDYTKHPHKNWPFHVVQGDPCVGHNKIDTHFPVVQTSTFLVAEVVARELFEICGNKNIVDWDDTDTSNIANEYAKQALEKYCKYPFGVHDSSNAEFTQAMDDDDWFNNTTYKDLILGKDIVYDCGTGEIG